MKRGVFLHVTEKGTKWEMKNSLWMLWTLTGLLSCAAFFWIGARTGRKLWYISGLVYLVVNLGFFFALPTLEAFDENLYAYTAFVVYTGFAVAFIQAIVARKAYLLRREAALG